MPKFTCSPGPFRVGAHRSCEVEILDANGCEVARVVFPMVKRELSGCDVQEANAALLASAPDLLMALRAVQWGGSDRDEHGVEVATCPWCGCEKAMGHASDCGLAMVIARATGGVA